eukprot:6180556-Pyramimonas_sp.AAC.1
MFVANVTGLSDKVWKYISKNSAKYQCWGIIETHVHEREEFQKCDQKARQMHYRLHHNPARSSGKVASERKQHRSNEGGE